MELVFATSNRHKLDEANGIIKSFKILSLTDISCYDDIPETKETIYDNAVQKATYLWEKYHVNCFSDDTGLEVDALDGKPGVYSARYAGEQRNGKDNNEKLLRELKGVDDRRAHFHTEVALILEGKLYTFEGLLYGYIEEEEKGTNGFGYDSVFRPEGYDITLAQMSAEMKNSLSHRTIALRKLAEFLNNQH